MKIKFRNWALTALSLGLFLNLILVSQSPAMALLPIPYAEGQNISFLNNQGQKLHALLFQAEETQAVLISVHGLQSHSGWFFSGPSLAQSGITTLAYDRRGSGLSEGQKGHAAGPEDFLWDLAAAIDAAKKIAPGKPIHIHANCFGVRTVVPYVVNFDKLKEVKSVIFTSPSTNMSADADYTPADKLCIKGFAAGQMSPECAHLIAKPGYLKSPVEDELFVSQGPWLDSFVKTDILGLKEMTPGFLMSAGALTVGMMTALQQKVFNIPMLVVLGEKDKMVDNEGIMRDLVTPYSGMKKVLNLPCEHGFEFCESASVDLYRKTMIDWILQPGE